jgi:hypothetical protein
MEAPGKGMLKVVSILFIIFGAIGVVASIISVVGVAAASSLVAQMGDEAQAVMNAAMGAVGPIIIVGLIIAIVGCLLELILGIVGLKKCGDASQANFFIVCGIILCALQLVSMIMSFSVISLVGFVLPILYIVGGSMNKKVTAAPAA